MVSPENTNWLFDFGLIDDIPVAGNNFPAEAGIGFYWPSQGLNRVDAPSLLPNPSSENADSHEKSALQKRARTGSCRASGSKACREKMRRDRLNDRFLELGSILEPGKPPRVDKTALLSDAILALNQLRSEAQKLEEANEGLQAKIKELKAEKNELRDEKQRLKADKESLKLQAKSLSAPAGFMPHPSAVPGALAAQGQAAGNKMMPFIGYPGVAMWQLMPPAAVDTSQDHVLRPPVA